MDNGFSGASRRSSASASSTSSTAPARSRSARSRRPSTSSWQPSRMPSKKRKLHYPRTWSWPGKAKICVSLNMALESFVRASQVTLEKTSNKVDHFSLTYADYAYKAGIWRLMDLMDELKIKGSCSTNGLTGERHPGIVRQLADYGVEIVGHAWAQDITSKDDDPEQELAD